MLRDGQAKMMETVANPMSAMPGYDAMRAQQEAFLKAMTGGWNKDDDEGGDELTKIRQQLTELQDQLSKLGK